MSDEEDDQMDETEAEKEAQYGFELENGTFFGEISLYSYQKVSATILSSFQYLFHLFPKSKLSQTL